MKKKIISKLHGVDRIFGFTCIKFLSIFANFVNSDELADLYKYIYKTLSFDMAISNQNINCCFWHELKKNRPTAIGSTT
jgi:hypothetical protein